MIKEYLDKQPVDELEIAFNYLQEKLSTKQNDKKSMSEILLRETSHDLCCPNCKSKFFYRNGHTKTGLQKYICKECHKSFSITTNTTIYHSKCTYDKWKNFVKCELLHLTLKESAAETGISINCAFSWRHKLHEAAKKLNAGDKLSGIIELDATYQKINLKGLKATKMPRISKKRASHGSSLKGISHHKVCIVSGCDTNDNMILRIAGLGKETIEFYENTLSNKIENPHLIITDNFWGFITFCKNHFYNLDQIPSNARVSLNGNNIQTLNGIHSELDLFLKKYKGVSLKHLQGYLDMFILLKKMNFKYEQKEKLHKLFLDSIPSKNYIKEFEIPFQSFPVDLKKAYGEYHYGIYA